MSETVRFVAAMFLLGLGVGVVGGSVALCITLFFTWITDDEDEIAAAITYALLLDEQKWRSVPGCHQAGRRHSALCSRWGSAGDSAFGRKEE